MCPLCYDGQEQDSSMTDVAPRLNSTTSLDSEVFVDSMLQERLNANDGTLDTAGQKYLTSSSLCPLRVNGSGSGTVEYPPNCYNDHNMYILDNNKVKDVRIVGAGGSLEGTEGGVSRYSDLYESMKEEIDHSHSFDVETDNSIWLPPDPEDMEDDVEGNMANYSDDDECSDGTKWCQPSPLSRLCEDRIAKVKEKFQKAMALVMNGRFKDLVLRLLQSEGIVISQHPDESWVDIVTSLAWEAALFVMADTGGEIMDPEGVVKVKCIAAGSRSQSKLIKGLVFKKNAAHKHMLTKHKNPKLLLLEGMLGQSPSGLSSFNSVEQEKDHLESTIEMIEMCHPNVVLVEKTVSRDVQESFVTKGITLVFDMKPQRLERIAKYADSKIFSTDDNLMSQKLKQCESFYFEKFVEEHVITRDGAKKPVKTLMFLEGFNRPLGCTILLKGAYSDELKKIKFVVRSAFIEAYHLILETSFLVDQRATFSSTHFMVVDELPKDKLPIVGSSTLPNASYLKESLAGTASSLTLDVPISVGSGETPACERTTCNTNMDLEQNSALPGFISDVNSEEKENGQRLFIRPGMSGDGRCYRGTAHYESVPTVFSGNLSSLMPASLKESIVDNYPPVSFASRQIFSTSLGYEGNEHDSQNKSVSPLYVPSEEPTYCYIEVKDSTDIVESPDDESIRLISACTEVPVQLCLADMKNEGGVVIKNDGATVLDSQSILYLVSSRCASKRTICEQSRLCRVHYYDFMNFDVSLGNFLRDTLNQTHRCTACGEPRKAHVYNYVNRSGKLTVRVKELSVESQLPGEAEGKLWMWAQCSKCERINKNQGSTRRVVMSAAARGLSFGKFLELSFSVRSAFNRLSGCGHSPQTDYRHFFGLGPMVIMFTYSPINIYRICMPPPVLDFNNPIGQGYIEKEENRVLEKWILLFTEVMGFLRNIESKHHSLNSNLKDLSEVREMVRQEKNDFQARFLKITDESKHLGQSVRKLLSLNSLIQELFLLSYVWDQRLRFLLSSDFRKVNTDGTHKPMLEEAQLLHQKDDIKDQSIEGRENASEHFSDGTSSILIDRSQSDLSLSFSTCDDVMNHCSNPGTELEIRLDGISIIGSEHPIEELQVSEHQREFLVPEPSHKNSVIKSFVDVQDGGSSTMGGLNVDGTTLHECPTSTTCRVSNDSLLRQDSCTGLSHLSPSYPTHDGKCQEHLPISEPLQTEKTIPIIEEQFRDTDSVAVLDSHASEFSGTSSMLSFKGMESLASKQDNSQSWIWNSFSEIHKAYKMDFQGGYSQKFEFIDGYTPEFLSPANQLITGEGCKLYIPLGPEDRVVSAYESEPTSIIACALASLHEDLVEKVARKEKSGFEGAVENAPSPDSDDSVASTYWSSNGSLDSEGIHSGESVSSEESYASFFDASALVDPMRTEEDPHLDIRLGVGKLPMKEKYSVVCLYEKQFRALRRDCCPSELDYISSLSRCKNWDAQGGKSGSLFVKTLDDRFIAKQIQKTEFESFLKFGLKYFDYVNKSLSSGNQTCLSRILGVYQVTIRQSKSGKDLKYHLMVTENLLYGRHVTRLYDLKGSQYARYVSDADGTEKVLLDGNFAEDMNISPLYLGGKAKRLLERAIWNDTSFLTSINVMDYSLLVGVDMQRLELVCGIIDYLRQYTWDKQLETLAKVSLVVPKNVTPTVVPPADYKKRFRKFMHLHFLSVPDYSRSEISEGPHLFCGDRSDSIQLNNAELTENN